MNLTQRNDDATVGVFGIGIAWDPVACLGLRGRQLHPRLAKPTRDVRSVDVHQAFQGPVVHVAGDRFSYFVQQHECRLVRHPKLPGQRQGADAFDVGGEDEDGLQDGLEWQLVVCEGCSTGHREHPCASNALAAPLPARRDPVVVLDGPTAWTDLGARVAPALARKEGMHIRGRQRLDFFKPEVASFFGQQEMTSHDGSLSSMSSGKAMLEPPGTAGCDSS